MNLDIEGTKHEKVVIIVLSYVIGFTAGFICFGVAQSIRHEDMTVTMENTPVHVAPAEVHPVNDVTAPVVADTTAIPDAASAATQNHTLTVTYTDGRLQAKVGDNVYLLSMKSSGMDSAVQSAFKNQGMHADIPAYVASPDNKYVYFCEQQAAVDSCNSFIFDVDKNMIEYVTVDGKKLSTTGAVAKTAAWSDKGLTINGKTSADATAPAALLAS